MPADAYIISTLNEKSKSVKRIMAHTNDLVILNRNLKNFVLVLLMIFTLSRCKNTNEEGVKCYIMGQVVGAKSRELILVKATEDAKYRGIKISVSNDGTFEYLLKTPYVEEYNLIFVDDPQLGYWRRNYFFPDSDTVKFTLYSTESANQNTITGSDLTYKINEFNNALSAEFGSEHNLLYNQMDSLENVKSIDSTFMTFISNKIDSINLLKITWQLEYFENDLSLFSYSRLLSILRNDRYISPDLLEKSLDMFKKSFPNHPYNSIAENELNAFKNARIGGQFVDFTANDASGNPTTLSVQIAKNKLTLLDLWAPWCGPCIRKSKKLPLYDKLKTSGFDIIGVVGGISTEAEFTRAVEKHNYPWLMLMEVSDKNRIWEKYKISRSGGSQFLIDSKGKILEINPDPERIIRLLSEL